MKRDAGGGRRDAWGFTLVEVLVVLALVGLMTGISGLALASLDPTPQSEALAGLRRARAHAIATGHPVALTVASPDTGADHAPRPTHRFFPDGSARGPGVDPLTGAPRAAR